MIDKQTEIKPGRKNRADWEHINALWEKDKKPQKQFCIELGINYTSFTYWRCALAKQKNGGHFSQGFALAKLETPPSKQIATPPVPIKIHYPNGVMVSVCCELDAIGLSALRSLIEVPLCR